MSYFLKFTKNDAGWLQMHAQRDTDRAPIDVLTEDVGYFPVYSLKEEQINLPNSADNYIECAINQWRDGNGDPSPRGPWQVNFQIVNIVGPDYKESPVTPVYDASGKYWADNGGIVFVINPRICDEELLEANQKRYDDWKKATGR